MNKKFVCAALAVLMMASTSAICASAAETNAEASGAAGTIKFDLGDWNHGDNVNFYIWDAQTGECCSKNGWVSDNLWGSKKIRGTAVEGEDGIVESYEIDFSGREDHSILVIFHDNDTSAQTYDCVITEAALGHTAKMSGDKIENPVDSEQQATTAVFEGVDGCGPHKQITSTGNIVGTCTAPGDDPAAIVADYVFRLIGVTDKSGEECCTEEKVANAISEFGTTANDVWDTFQTFADKEGYADKVDGAKKLINPSEASSDVESQVESQVESTVESKVESVVESKVESVVESKVESKTEATSSVKPTASAKTASAVKTTSTKTTSTKATTSTTSTKAAANTSSTAGTSSTGSTVTSPKTGSASVIPVLLACLASVTAIAASKRKESE